MNITNGDISLNDLDNKNFKKYFEDIKFELLFIIEYSLLLEKENPSNSK